MHGYALLGTVKYLSNTLLSANPVDFRAQNDPIGATGPMSIEAILAAPNGCVRLSRARPNYAPLREVPVSTARRSARKRRLPTAFGGA